MQETVKLISNSEFRKGQINSLPDVGDVSFSPEGIAEVPAELAQLLVDLLPDLSFLEKAEDEPVKKEEKIKPQVQEEDLNKADEKDALQPQTEENDITGSKESVIISEEEKQDDTEDLEKVEEVEDEKQEESPVTPNPEEIQAKLEASSFEDLKAMVSQLDPALTVKSKKAAIEFLLTKLV